MHPVVPYLFRADNCSLCEQHASVRKQVKRQPFWECFQNELGYLVAVFKLNESMFLSRSAATLNQHVFVFTTLTVLCLFVHKKVVTKLQ